MVGVDVVGNASWKHVRAGFSGVQSPPQGSRGDVFVHRSQEVYAALLVRREVEGGKIRKRKIRERKARAADDDPLGQFEQTVRLVPAGKVEKAVCTDKVEERVLGHGPSQLGQRVRGVVGEAVGARGIDGRGLKTLVLLARQSRHGEAVGEGRGIAVELQRLAACRGEEDSVELKSLGSGPGDREMTAVRWIEGAAEESDAQRLDLSP